MDGTIADSFDYVSEILSSGSGKPPLTTDQKQALRGMSMAGMAKRLGYHWWDAPRLFYKGRHRMKQAIKHIDAFAGMTELVQKLHAEGHELFVLSTNSPTNINNFLKNKKINDYFLEVYGGVGVFSKASALKQLLKEQNLDIKQAVYVGDEVRDVEAAQSIGLRAIAVTWGFARRDSLVKLGPAALADTPAQLTSILEEL